MVTYELVLQALKNCIFDDLYEHNIYENVLDVMDCRILPLETYDTGATKLVLIPCDADFVIKIPFHGVPNEDFDPDKEPEDEWDFCNYPYYSFENADEPDHWNYCKAEAIRYESTVEAGISMLFAKTELIGYIKGSPIYAQPKCRVFGHEKTWDSYSEEQKKSTKDKCRDLNVDCFNTAWLCDFLEFYSTDTLIKLNSWLQGFAIWDLHDGNLGYTMGGYPIIIDYSDFND